MIAGLVAAGLAIDLGRLYYTQRDLQRIANLAALDSVRVAGGCEGDITDPASAALGEALTSVLRNGGQSEWLTSTAADILGRMHTSGGLRSFQPIPEFGNRAVQVKVSRPAPSRLIPGLGGGGTAKLTALSAAYETPSALVQVGARLATINPPDSGPLNALTSGLLGNSLNIDLLSYQHLFEAQVPLGTVLENLGLNPGDADAPTSLSQVVLAVADAIGDPTAAAAAQQMYQAADGSRQVVPSRLGLDDTSSGTFVSAGELLVSAGAASLDGTPVTIPVNLPPPLGAGSTTLRLLDPGVLTRLLPGGIMAAAQNFAHNTSLVLQTQTPFTIAVLGDTGQLSFFVQAAHSTAEVVNIQCARRGLPDDTVDVSATSSIARIGIGRFDDINSPHPQPQPISVLDTTSTLNVLTLHLPIKVKITAQAYVDVGQEDSADFLGMKSGEVRRLGTPSTTALAAAIASIPGNLQVDVDISLLGPVSPLIQGTVNTALAALTSTLKTTVTAGITNQLLNQIDDLLLPQLDALGVTIGGADVTIAKIDADEPILFTH